MGRHHSSAPYDCAVYEAACCHCASTQSAWLSVACRCCSSASSFFGSNCQNDNFIYAQATGPFGFTDASLKAGKSLSRRDVVAHALQ